MFNLSAKSWIQVTEKAVDVSDEDVQAMWDACPKTRDHITIYGKTHPLPRFQKLFGEARYKFSGIQLVPDPVIPALVQRCLDYAREKYPELSWNGALANFYPDGESYISPHSDDERDLTKGAPILSFSFGGVRTFLVQAKEKHLDKAYATEIKFPTKHNSLIVMGGGIQTEFTHGIPKTTKRDGVAKRRINVTVRAFAKPGAQGVKRMKQEEEEEEFS